MNPVFTGLSLALLGAGTPIILGPYVPRWESGADADVPATARRGSGLRRALGRLIAGAQQARAGGLLITSPAALPRVIDPDRHRGCIFEVPHAIDLGQFAARRAIPSRPSILFLAGVARRKGIFTLLEAFDRVAAAIPEASLVIAGGEGGDLEEVRRLVAATPGRAISLLGAVSRAEVQALMRQHSVYCLPSYGEPVGMGILEAMACGIPVVATRAGGVPDIVDDAGARLVPPRDAAALAAALIEVLGSAERQRTMGRANRARIEAHFEAERLTDRLERAYLTVCAGRLSLDESAGGMLRGSVSDRPASPADGETGGVS
jgi:glycosyltransferase involved in cell wall biosynthesis